MGKPRFKQGSRRASRADAVGWAYLRRSEPGGFLTHLLALAQTLLVTLSPWLYAPRERRGRLAWFAAATLVAGALAVRAYMTGT